MRWIYEEGIYESTGIVRDIKGICTFKDKY